MNLISAQLAAASTLLCLTSNVMADGSSGVIHFTGAIVEPLCELSMAPDTAPSSSSLQLDLHCPKRTAFDVSFQRVGSSAKSAASSITFTRNGKPLSPAAAAAAGYAMAFQGTSRLALAANQVNPRAAALGPVLMTITYQ